MSKVILEVVVEGKNVKVVQKDIENLAKSTNKAAKGLKNTGESISDTDRRLKGASKQSSNTTKNFSKMSQGITGGLVPAYATLAANIFAVTAAFSFLKSAGDLVTLQRGQEAYASATGVALRTLSNDIISATNAQIKFTDASQAAAIGTAAGLSPDQLIRLGTAAKDVSIVLGRDVTDSFNRLVRGVTKAEPELLDELGIVLRLKDATEAYAQSLGKNAKDLTAFERSQAVANDVLAQAEDKYGRILAVTQPQANAFSQLAVSFDNLINKIKEFSAVVIGPFASAISQFPLLGVAILGIFGKGVLTAAVPGLRELGNTAREAAETAKMKFMESEAALENYQRSLKKTVVQVEKLKAAQKLQALSTGAADPGFTSATFDSIRQGRASDLSARQLAGFKGAITKSKVLTAEMKTEWQLAIQNMINETKKGTKIIEVEFTTLSQKIGLGFRRIEVLWTGALARMRAAAAAFTAFASTALSVLGWVSLVATLGTVVYQFFKTKESADETSKALEYQTGKIKSLNEEFKNFNEVQNIITEDGNGMLQYFTALGTRIGQLNLSGLTETLDLSANAEAFDQYVQSTLKNIDRLSGNGGIRGIFARIIGKKDIKLLESRLSTANRLIEQGVASPSTVQAAEDLKAELDALNTTIEESSANFGDFLNTSDDQRLKQLGQYFSGLTKNLETVNKNFGGEGSKSIKTYLQLLKQVEESTTVEQAQSIINGKSFKDAEVAVKAATDSFNAYTKAVQDNQRLIGQVRGSFLQPSQTSQAITSIELEIELTKTLVNEFGKLEKAQLDRITQREKDLQFATLLNNSEQERADREQAINIQREKSLRGLTKLQADLIGQQLEQKKIESDRKFLFDQQNIVLNAIRDNDNKATREQRERLFTLQQQLDTLKEQEASLQRQGDYSAQLVDTINQAFEDGLQRGLEDLITGKEKSLKDAIVTLTLNILTSMASTLAKQLTENLTQIKFTDRLKTTFEQGAVTLSAAIRGALGSPVTPVASAEEVVGGDAPTSRTVSVASEGKQVLSGGIFSSFINSLKDIFSPDVPFLDKLSGIFTGGFDAIKNIFKGVFSGGSGITGILSTIATSFFANGGIVNGGLRAMASGGTVSQPTLAMIGEGRYNEAVVPLPDGKTIPVQMQGSSGGQNNVTVNVSVDNNGNAQQQVTGDQAGNLGSAIAKAVQRELQNQKRSGGILNPYGVA